MGRPRRFDTLEGTPWVAVGLYLRNMGAARNHQFQEGQVTARVHGTDDFLMIKLTWSKEPVKLPVRYSTCNGKAFEIGDWVLCVARNCVLAQMQVIGFTRAPRHCFSFDGQIHGVKKWAPTPVLDNECTQFQIVRADLGASALVVVGTLSGGNLRKLTEDDYADDQMVWNMNPYNTSANTSSMEVTAPRWDGNNADDVWVAHAPETLYGVRHGDHMHTAKLYPYYTETSVWAAFPVSGVVVYGSPPSPSLDSMYCGLRDSTCQKTSITGVRVVGCPYGATSHLGFIEGTLDTDTTGVLWIAPASGNKGQLLSVEYTNPVVKTWELAYASWDVRVTNTHAASQANAWSNVYGSSLDRRALLPDCTIIVRAASVCWEGSSYWELQFPGWLTYGYGYDSDWGQPDFAPSARYGPCSPGVIYPEYYPWGMGVTQDTFTPFARWAHSETLEHEVVTGVPSPALVVGDTEHYVLVPVAKHKFIRHVDATPSSFVPGLDPESALPYTDSIAGQGEYYRKNRVWAVRTETAVPSLGTDADATVTRFDVGRNANDPYAFATCYMLETNSRWREMIYAKAWTTGDPEHGLRFNSAVPFTPLNHFWNKFRRRTPYHIVGASESGQDVGATIPLGAPGGAQFSRQVPGAWSSPGGNWVPSKYKNPLGVVAAWSFGWMPRQPSGGQRYYSQPYFHNGPGEPRMVGDYCQDSFKQPWAQGDKFSMWSGKLGTEMVIWVYGAHTNPGTYLSYPTCTPDFKKFVFLAHGVFLLGADPVWRMFAGLYYVDMTDPVHPVITLISPCELRVPGRTIVCWSNPITFPVPLATGHEIVISEPDQEAEITAPSLWESQLAYFFGQRRKSFADSSGRYLLSESGVMLDLLDPSAPKMYDTFFANAPGPTGRTGKETDYDMCWRASFEPQ